MTPLFLGLSGPVLTPDEIALFRQCDPAGYILFARNCIDPDQMLALTDSLRSLAQRDLPILIDQEGGRVARMKPPIWAEFPPAARFGALYDVAPVTAIEAARLNALVLALTLRDAGVTVDCLPLLDVRAPGGHDIIGDRSYGEEPMRVAALGKATLDGLRAGGVIGVVKHIPGHGRATVDSHLGLPVVTASREELEVDFEPFRSLNTAPMAMTAHIVYPALDPEHCATLSATVIAETIRRDIGFDGLLMSDDIGMKAIGGSFAQRTRGCLAAGCDIALHCSGVFAEMVEVAAAAPPIGHDATSRLGAAMLWPIPPHELSIADLTAQRDALLAFG
nr:beta-N-acetylhexosaminidase [Polymorphobacter sp.]